MKKNGDYILWLPSWYPNEFEPYNGDFIQRHALATSNYCKIVVFHFIQLGHTIQLEKDYFRKNEMLNLTEFTIAPSFKPTRSNIINKLIYNYKFYSKARNSLNEYFKKNGLPIKVHVHVPLKAGNIALWIKKKYGIDYVLSEHSSHYLSISQESYFKKSYLYKIQVKSIFKSALKVSNVSEAIGNILRDIFAIPKVETIHNTVNTKYFNYGTEKNNVFTYIHVSSLKNQKNIYGILSAFEELYVIEKKWQLKLVGPITKEIVDYITSKKFRNHIILTGEISYKDVAHQMQQSHVFVLFSKHENFPCVIIEALCCGLPVISSNVAGIKEAVNNKNGILIESNDQNALLNALIDIKNNYYSFRFKEISNNAQDLYNYKVIGKQIFNLYSIS